MVSILERREFSNQIVEVYRLTTMEKANFQYHTVKIVSKQVCQFDPGSLQTSINIRYYIHFESVASRIFSQPSSCWKVANAIQQQLLLRNTPRYDFDGPIPVAIPMSVVGEQSGRVSSWGELRQ